MPEMFQMTKIEKIQALYEDAIENTESFAPLGADLLYLVGAICHGSHVEFSKEDSGLLYLKEVYGKTPRHWVWKYVKEVPSDKE